MSKPIQHGIFRIDENVDLLHKALNRIKIDISDIKSELKQIKSIMNEEKIIKIDVNNDQVKQLNKLNKENNSWWWS
tara:strand:+ start:3793 stop:4020 length:228 start_codon:yes stop_codon:yes gene_type:complete